MSLTSKKGAEKALNEVERDDIRDMVEKAKYLAENDPNALLLAKNSIDILKARCDLECQAAGEGR